MKNRKTKKSDLEGKILIFFQIGVVIALLTVLSFQYKSYEKSKIDILEQDGIEIPIDFVIRTKHVKPPPVKKHQT